MPARKDKDEKQISIFDLIDKDSEIMPGKSAKAAAPEVRHTEEVTSMELPLDWENYFDTDTTTAGMETDSVSDGFIKCLNHLGRVDIEYISSITGKEYKEVIEELKGAIYQNPDTWGECFFKGWETADEYISGNVREKLRRAKEADREYNGYFKDNVRALKDALPKGVSTDDIYITLGSPWVPTTVIVDFIKDVINNPVRYLGKKKGYNCEFNNHIFGYYIKVIHDEITGTWEFPFSYKDYHYNYVGAALRYGTTRYKPLEILLRTLNMQSVAVYDTLNTNLTKSGKKSVLNKDETVLALEKQRNLIVDFQEWVWKDPDRKKLLLNIYTEKYLSIKQRHFDGSFLKFPTMNEEISLFPYQKNAVARIIFSPNTLLAHEVGSGKTYVMIAAGMELKRLGQSKKNLYVVPNNIIGQWRSIFMSMYPEANLLTIEPKDFTKDKREACLQKIMDMDYDGIIMPYSSFEQIPISVECRIEMLNLEIKKLEEASKDPTGTTKKMIKLIERLKEERKELAMTKEEEGICFDKLGITRLFVDEAHNFKNVPIETKITNVMGISTAGSKKCKDMMDKVRIVQKQNMGKGVVLATGTPITNSITDAYIMQSYLQSGELAILELQSFDSWVGMFAEQAANFEIDVDTSTYRLATRFSKFHNIPELTTLLASIADFHQVDESNGIPAHNGYDDVMIKKTQAFQAYLSEISKRADTVRSGRISRKEDNMLKITTDGRKAALDLRLVDDKAAFTTYCKAFSCAENVANLYRLYSLSRSTQLIFCDTSTPKKEFNLYDELKSLLVKMQVPAEEIAFIHEATTEAKREKLFEKVRRGEIRVLIGSTFKLGLGVNVQDKLVAVHHLDVPWRPADMVQREGRILRQGNENKSVYIYRYITEGSFDAYSWQLLETKQRFITDLLSGFVTDRDGADIDDTVLNYAEVKALAVGNPLIKKRVELANELSRYQILQKKLISNRMRYEAELSGMPELISTLERLIPLCKEDMNYYLANKREYEPEERRVLRELIYNATHTDEATSEEQLIGEYQGFTIIVPKKVSAGHPVIKLKRNGEYTLELTQTEIGSMQRIDRCLEELQKRYEDYVIRLSDMRSRMAFMKKELEKNEDYAGLIAGIKEEIEAVDKKLGVNNE